MRLPSFKIDWPNDLKQQMLTNVKDVVDNGMVASSKYVKRCEDAIKERSGTPYVYAVSSGSAALEAAAYAVRKERGLGRVLVPANTFCSSALAFERLGFEIEFYKNNLTTVDFELPKEKNYVGLVVVDLGGIIPFDVGDLVGRCHDSGMWVCEDACQAFGSHLGGKHAGTFADIGAYSFFSTKLFTSGEGGAVVTKNPNYAQSTEMYRDFGKPSMWKSYHYEKGWNYRMNEFGAAILSAQLEDYDKIVENRGEIRLRYRNALKGVDGIQLLAMPGEPEHWFGGYKVIAFLDKTINKSVFLKACEEQGVKFQGSVYDYTMLDQPIYWGAKAIGKNYAHDPSRMICFPTWYGMEDAEVDHVVDAVKSVINTLRG